MFMLSVIACFKETFGTGNLCFTRLDGLPALRDEVMVDRNSQTTARARFDGLRKEALELDTQIRQLQDALETLVRIQARSLESQLFNKANELQEDISLKRFDLRVAQIHLAAVRSQKEMFASKVDSGGGGGVDSRERKLSSSSSGSMKNKWVKAFKSIKGGKEPADTNRQKNGKDNGAPQPPPVIENAHIFQEYTYKKITPCDVCSQILRGHTRQGLKCKLCRMNVHPDCQEGVPKCQPKSRLLRRQKSASEIDARVNEHNDPGDGEGASTPSSPVHNRRLLSARTTRMSSVELPDENEKSVSSASTSPCPSPKPHRLLPTNLYVVLYNFKPRQADELDLKAGYKLTVIDTSDKDWWKGKCLGSVGFFPSSYVTKLMPGEKPLQVLQSVQIQGSTAADGNIKLLRDQIVIQLSEDIREGIAMIRTAEHQQGACPIQYLQEV